LKKHLIIFIDSLPFLRLSLGEFISSLPTQVRLIPNLGYSVNLLPELFCGLSPDKVGFYGEWTYDPDRSPLRSQTVGKVLQIMAKTNYFLDRLIHKGLGRLMKVNLAQVPFELLPFFSHRSKSVYSPPLSEKAFFSMPETAFNLILAQEVHCKGMGLRDDVVFSNAHRALSTNLFLSLVDLDGFGHKFGVGSPEHDRYVKYLDKKIAILWEAFCKANKGDECRLFVLSDHGMSNVNQVINFNIQSRFGPPSPSRYVYFLDATILRVWAKDNKIRRDIQDYLSGQKVGRLITTEEREVLGLLSSYVGDLLYVLEEGYIFLPSFHGLRLIKGMHGYHPNTLSQHAVLCCSDKLTVDSTMCSRGVFALIRNSLLNKI